MTVYFEYCEEGEVVSDFKVEEWCHEKLALPDGTVVKFATELVNDVIRCWISNSELDKEAATFIFKGQHLKPNEYGRLDPWPPGFCDIGLHFLTEMLTGATKKYKAEKNGTKTD